MSESNNSDNQEKVLVTFLDKEIETTESAIEKYSDDGYEDENGLEVYVEPILKKALGIDPEGFFAVSYLERFFDKNYNIIGYKIVIQESNIKLKSDDQKKVFNYNDLGTKKETKNSWDLYFDKNENPTSDKNIIDKIENKDYHDSECPNGMCTYRIDPLEIFNFDSWWQCINRYKELSVFR